MILKVETKFINAETGEVVDLSRYQIEVSMALKSKAIFEIDRSIRNAVIAHDEIEKAEK